jgi:hypothetical protein
MRRWVILAFATAFVAVPAAYADIYVIIANTTVHRGGYLRGTGDGSRLPFYLVPKRLAPAYGDRMKRAPRRPYVFLGRLRRTRNPYATQHFRFRVPRVRPGKYKVVIWCRPCGGTLILAGPTGFGQTVTVLP